MNILVTGATGFLGTALCKRLESGGNNVTRLGSKTCDLTVQGSLEPWSGENFDQVFHLAAWTQAGDFCLRHPAEQWIINQQMNTNIVAAWQEHWAEAKFIFMGTSCAYAPDLELVEEKYLDGVPIESLFTYAMTKRMLYAGALALQKQYGMKWLCLVPSTLYGPGYHTDARQMHFIFDLIRKILRAKLYDEKVVLWGDGYQSRELVFLDDFVELGLRLTRDVDNELVNIGAGEEFTIRHFAQLICEKVGYDMDKIEFDTSRYVGAKSKCLDTAKLARLVPDWQMTALDTGLGITIDWFMSEREALLPEKAC